MICLPREEGGIGFLMIHEFQPGITGKPVMVTGSISEFVSGPSLVGKILSNEFTFVNISE